LRPPSEYSRQANETRLKALQEKGWIIGDVVVSSYGLKNANMSDFGRIVKIGSTGRLTVKHLFKNVRQARCELFSMSSLKALRPRECLIQVLRLQDDSSAQVLKGLTRADEECRFDRMLDKCQWAVIARALQIGYPMHFPFFIKKSHQVARQVAEWEAEGTQSLTS